MLDVRRLRLLSELAHRGTIAAVARAVGYSPSAVSQSLSALEREAGMTLLERDGRHVRLTPAARRLVARADRVLAELAAAEAELAAEHGAVRGEVVVGAFPSAGSHLVVPAVGALAAFGDLTVSVREHEPEDGIGLLRSGELDLLISESYDDVPPAPVGGLEQRLLVSEELLLVVTAEHDGALSALSTADWVGGVAGTQYAAAVERACANAGFAPRIQHRADDATLIQALTAARLGVALLPELACTPYEGVRYVSASPAPPRRNVAALLRTGAARRPAVAAVLDALTAALLARSRRARTSAP